MLWQREVGCRGVLGQRGSEGRGESKAGGSLPGPGAVPSLLPESCEEIGKVKGGWVFSFSLPSPFFSSFTVSGSMYMVP